MTSLYLEDITFLLADSLLYGILLAVIAKKVGNSRRKHKVNPPETNGPIEFVCTFRAQQNCTEWFPIFITALWGAGLFFHQVPAAIVGLVFVYSRHKYFHDYSERASKRVSPFWMGTYCVLLMFFMAGIGLTHQLLKMYVGVDLAKKALTLYYGSL
ncbi:hypothetical protein ACJMK2_032569 [Sinanodonta woodiana]|uniref:Microsomal glutathione S-transferase 2 n=1 Tax=Sinanodonta woodiana TaxID=1069815 RepID=A0ABD3X3M1_SINWO